MSTSSRGSAASQRGEPGRPGRKNYTQEKLSSAPSAVQRQLAAYEDVFGADVCSADESVTKVKIGDTIALTKPDFERLAAAFFAELERKFS